MMKLQYTGTETRPHLVGRPYELGSAKVVGLAKSPIAWQNSRAWAWAWAWAWGGPRSGFKIDHMHESCRENDEYSSKAERALRGPMECA
ncbi:hypothetical protein EUGRSUZ_I02365 [Eucalyptus grandis]|uniref:Uncharacterized protein n=2 Tax=Eucalyptus grandis TaxID=71139 RepID=A0A059ARQ8_EUCGR|nr:hypothetical protein EUGRSUZ_I02365 [Eucalyptus grandis]